MRAGVLVFLLAILGFLSYKIWHETDNLALIEQTFEPTPITLFNTQSFVLPEPTKITNKDKTITEFYSAKDVQEAFLNAKKDNAFYLAFEKNIYSELSTSFVLVLVFGIAVGGIFGYWIRDPIDKYDFKSLEEKTERELGIAWKETRKAQETAKNAQLEAVRQANTDVENELAQAKYQRSEAEKERIAAIKAQQAAAEEIKKAKIQISEALRIADESTRKKNAAYSAAERFKRKAEKKATLARAY
jgi:hypothetical protein